MVYGESRFRRCLSLCVSLSASWWSGALGVCAGLGRLVMVAVRRDGGHYYTTGLEQQRAKRPRGDGMAATTAYAVGPIESTRQLFRRSTAPGVSEWSGLMLGVVPTGTFWWRDGWARVVVYERQLVAAGGAGQGTPRRRHGRAGLSLAGAGLVLPQGGGPAGDVGWEPTVTMLGELGYGPDQACRPCRPRSLQPPAIGKSLRV